VKYIPLFHVALVEVWVHYHMLLLLLMGFVSWRALFLLHLLPNSVIFLGDVSRVLVATLELFCLDILNQLVVQARALSPRQPDRLALYLRLFLSDAFFAHLLFVE